MKRGKTKGEGQTEKVADTLTRCLCNIKNLKHVYEEHKHCIGSGKIECKKTHNEHKEHHCTDLRPHDKSNNHKMCLMAVFQLEVISAPLLIKKKQFSACELTFW